MPAPTVFNAATGQFCHFPAILNPSGGAVIDAESRTATVSILGVLRSAAVIAGATSVNVGQAFNGATGQIVQGPAIAAPAGGATVDAEARATINSIRTVLANARLIAGATTNITSPVFDEDHFMLKVGASIAGPTGGATQDAQCRAVLDGALSAMRLSSLLAAD